MLTEHNWKFGGQPASGSGVEKRIYSRPVLKRYGSVTTITMGSGGSKCDFPSGSTTNETNTCKTN